MDTNITQTNQTKIVIYSTETCKYCVLLKDYLKEKGFNYEEIDVGRDAEQAQIMIQKSGQRGVPVSDINGHIVIGFDQDKVDELLNIK